MLVTQRDLKNSLFLVGAEGISRMIALLLTIVLARELGVAGFGKYSMAVSFVFIFSVFIEVGLFTLVF